MKLWYNLPEDGKNTKICRSQIIEITHRFQNCVVVGVTRVLIHHNAWNELCKVTQT